ncbi:MAG: hypothetical protein CMM93_04290 [Rickettsiales bacterium]|nr:hypothetical protein [Rickettsiales bacterium]|tara:strand:+ start:169 stop:1449 length:1281 start_codon:yes stop_codon:yes gene_type:complete
MDIDYLNTVLDIKESEADRRWKPEELLERGDPEELLYVRNYLSGTYLKILKLAPTMTPLAFQILVGMKNVSKTFIEKIIAEKNYDLIRCLMQPVNQNPIQYFADLSESEAVLLYPESKPLLPLGVFKKWTKFVDLLLENEDVGLVHLPLFLNHPESVLSELAAKRPGTIAGNIRWKCQIMRLSNLKHIRPKLDPTARFLANDLIVYVDSDDLQLADSQFLDQLQITLVFETPEFAFNRDLLQKLFRLNITKIINPYCIVANPIPANITINWAKNVDLEWLRNNQPAVIDPRITWIYNEEKDIWSRLKAMVIRTKCNDPKLKEELKLINQEMLDDPELGMEVAQKIADDKILEPIIMAFINIPHICVTLNVKYPIGQMTKDQFRESIKYADIDLIKPHFRHFKFSRNLAEYIAKKYCLEVKFNNMLI